MPESDDRKPKSEVEPRTASVEYIGYIGPPCQPMLVDRKSEVVPLSAAMAREGVECQTAKISTSRIQNQKFP
jgi:hypothetical protein